MVYKRFLKESFLAARRTCGDATFPCFPRQHRGGGGDPALGSRKPAAKPRRDGKDTGDIPRVVMGQEVYPSAGCGSCAVLKRFCGGIAGGARRCAG